MASSLSSTVCTSQYSFRGFSFSISPPGLQIFDGRVFPLAWRMINIGVLKRSLTGNVIETEALRLSQVIFVSKGDDR